MLGKCNLLFFISAVLLTLGSVASANKCTEAFFNAQAHSIFNQESNLRLDSIYYSQSPAGWNGKKYFYNESQIEKVVVDFVNNVMPPAYWFFYRDTNETVINQKDFYEYIDSTYRKQDTLFHHLKTYYKTEYAYTWIIKITTDYYSEKRIYEDETDLLESFFKQDTIIEINHSNYNTDSSSVEKTFYIADINDDNKCYGYDEQLNFLYTFTYSTTENGFSLKQKNGDNYIELFVINEDKNITSLRKTVKPFKIAPKARYFDLLGRFKFTK